MIICVDFVDRNLNFLIEDWTIEQSVEFGGVLLSCWNQVLAMKLFEFVVKTD